MKLTQEVKEIMKKELRDYKISAIKAKLESIESYKESIRLNEAYIKNTEAEIEAIEKLTKRPRSSLLTISSSTSITNGSGYITVSGAGGASSISGN
jgi:hypothetical protein